MAAEHLSYYECPTPRLHHRRSLSSHVSPTKMRLVRWWRLVRHILPIRVSIEKANKKDVAYIQDTMSDVDSFIIIVGYTSSLYSPKIMNRKRQPKKQINISRVLEASIWHQAYQAQQWCQPCQLLGLCSGLQPQRGRSFSVRQPVPQRTAHSAQRGRVAPFGATEAMIPRCCFGDQYLEVWGNDWWESVGMVIPVVGVLFCCFFWHVALVLQVGQSSPSSPSRGTNPQWRMSSAWAQSLRVLESWSLRGRV